MHASDSNFGRPLICCLRNVVTRLRLYRNAMFGPQSASPFGLTRCVVDQETLIKQMGGLGTCRCLMWQLRAVKITDSSESERH